MLLNLNLQAKCSRKYYKHVQKPATGKMEGKHLPIMVDNIDQGMSRLPFAHIQRVMPNCTDIEFYSHYKGTTT